MPTQNGHDPVQIASYANHKIQTFLLTDSVVLLHSIYVCAR